MPRSLRLCACTGCDTHHGRCPVLTPTRRCDTCAKTLELPATTRQRGGGPTEGVSG